MKNLKDLNRTTYFFIFLFIPLIGLMGCSKSDDKDDIANCTNWSDQWLAQANAYSAAATVYSNDPTVANCGKYKTAGLNYIDALESVIDCVPTGNAKEYSASLNEYRAEVNAIPCN